MKKKIRVLCIDDSALMRDLLREIVNTHADMEVVAVASDPLVARDLIKLHDPDVLTLDVEMPRMSGIDFLERLMRLRPMPVLMVSSLTAGGSEVALRALELGAVDCLEKPPIGVRAGMMGHSERIAEMIRVAAYANIRRSSDNGRQVPTVAKPDITSQKIVLLGASTGGTEVIREILEALPENSPAIVIAQHMPGGFTRSFAERLNKCCRIVVKEAENGEHIRAGHAYVAPGGAHLLIESSGPGFITRVEQARSGDRFRPSVNTLFHSGATAAGDSCIGALLTGMGKDGAAGLKAMREAGAATIAQDEASCIVYGMPREAVSIGAAVEVRPASQIAQRIIELSAAASGAVSRTEQPYH